MPSILKLSDGRTIYVREDFHLVYADVISDRKVLNFHDDRTDVPRFIVRAHIVEMSNTATGLA